MRRVSVPSLLGRAGVIACAATFLMVASGGAPASASVARHATLNTFNRWNGNESILPFGCPDTTTYGQVVKVPGNRSHLTKFRFSWQTYSGSGSMVVRGEVYAWHGNKATGPSLYESAPRTVSFGDSAFHKVVFKPGGIDVTPKGKYVIFATIDKDYEQCTGDYEVDWAAVSDDAYSPGEFVFQNNEGNEANWTTKPWTAFTIDLAFKAYLS